MEPHRGGKSRAERREIHSVCVPVPTIVLNSSAAKGSEQATLTHSRSAGDLDMVLADTDEYQASGIFKGISKFTGSVSGCIHNDGNNALGLYCSPRMLRRSQYTADSRQKRQSGLFIESLNACNLNCLEPGSRVGSTVSLNSEYTSRSIGLISNDSNSECSQHTFQPGVLDGPFHKHSLLKRFYSTPEKDDDLITYQARVRRNSKSMGNMQNEDMHDLVSFDLGSDSTADDGQQNLDSIADSIEGCDIDNSLKTRTEASETDDSEHRGPDSSQTLVKSVTGSLAMRDSRIRKWLVEIRDADEGSSS